MYGLYTALYTSKAIVLNATDIASAEAVGTPVITTLASLTPTGITSEEAIGTPIINLGSPIIFESWGFIGI